MATEKLDLSRLFARKPGMTESVCCYMVGS